MREWWKKSFSTGSYAYFSEGGNWLGSGSTNNCAARSGNVSVTASSTSTVNATCSVSGVNPYSGSQSAGAYSNGYQKWVKNVKSGSEVNSSTATKNTTLTYTNATAGNSSMTTGVQAVLPTSSSARTNDSAPTTSSQTVTATTHTALSNVTITSAYTTPIYYQGANNTSCDSLRMSISTGSIDAAKGTCVTPTKTYVRYTLVHNTSTMGYRPVIVVYKAN